MRSQADGGEILLSSVTSELVAAHLPEGCSVVDLGPHRLTGLGAPQRINALAGPGVRTPLSANESPYRGLLAFEPDDRAFFFGREDVTAKIVRRLAPGGLLAVVGASGSGKSSVLRAGVVAAVRAGEVDGLRRASLLTPGAAPALDAEDQPDRLVVVDQFEELFTLCDDTDRRRAFIDGLLRLRCAVAIGVRADIYGRLSGHRELALAVADNQVLLGPMDSGELERAITEPARLAGLKLEPGLVELIMRDVAAEPGALPLLSHALRATWERRNGRTLTVDGYRETGGVASAIGRTADRLVDALPDEQRRLVRGVLVRMTELGEGSEDSRRRVAVGELVPEGAAAGSVEALLRRLAEERLVTLDDGSAEVAHEALIREWPQLRRWLDEDRAGIRAHQRLGDAARLWDAGGREPSDLYRGARLAAALELVESRRAQLNASERAFLDAAAEEADRERRAERRTNRRLRGLLAGAVVLLVVALLGGALAVISRNSAQDAERAAEAQALTADAQRIGALSRSAPTLAQSMLYAAAAVEVEDSVETRGDLLATLQRNWAAVRSLPLSSANLTGAAVSRELVGQHGLRRDRALRRPPHLEAERRAGGPGTCHRLAVGRLLARRRDARRRDAAGRPGRGARDRRREPDHPEDRVLGRPRSEPGQRPVDGARVCPRRPSARRRAGDGNAVVAPHADLAAPAAPRRGKRTHDVAAALPAARRTGGGPPAVPPRRQAPQLRPAGRDPGVERERRTHPAPLSHRRPVRPLARSTADRHRPRHSRSGRYFCALRDHRAKSAHRKAERPRLAPQRQLYRWAGLHTRREADRRRIERNDHRVGRRSQGRRRDVRLEAQPGDGRRRVGPPRAGAGEPNTTAR